MPGDEEVVDDSAADQALLKDPFENVGVKKNKVNRRDAESRREDQKDENARIMLFCAFAYSACSLRLRVSAVNVFHASAVYFLSYLGEGRPSHAIPST
jgi:hypothetical protein